MSLKLTIYNNDCLNLAKSMLIKSDLLAKDVEYNLTNSTDYLERDRTSWKYYLNLSGNYHSSNAPMTITSLDTLEDIEFTKETLVEHPITQSKYLPNSSLLDTLITTYPENTLLIYGIIYALDIDDIINTDEYTILAYDTTLVTGQEINLIPELQTRLYVEFANFINKDYADIEPYYAMVAMAHLAKQVFMYIKIIRLSNYKTSRACDFYIWEEINGQVYLEDLKEYLNRDTIYYLNKNIDRLARDAGSNEVLYELINKLVVPRDMRAYRLRVFKDTTDINELTSSTTVVYQEEAISVNATDRDADIEEYIAWSEDASIDGIDNYTAVLESRINDGPDNNRVRELKIFEVIKNSADSQRLLMDLDLYAQAAMTGAYAGYHSISNHISGDVYSLTTREAIILYYYVVQCKLGLSSTYIPSYDPLILPRTTKPKVTELVATYGISTADAQDLIAAIPDYPSANSDRDTFELYISDFKIAIQTIQRQIQSKMTRRNQAGLSTIVNAFFYHEALYLTPTGVKYSDWLVSRGINISDFEITDIGILEEHLLDVVFNIDLTTQASGYAKAVAEIINRLNNYRINVHSEAQNSNLIDYHSTPIFSESYVNEVDSPTIQHRMSIDPITDTLDDIGYGFINILTDKLPSVALDGANEFNVQYKSTGIRCSSTLVSDPTSIYLTPIELKGNE